MKRLFLILFLCITVQAQSVYFFEDPGVPNQKPMLGTLLNPVVPDGLVGSWLFNEGSGTLVQDTSGNGNNGTLVGPEWVAGIHGPALDFVAANNDYVSFGTPEQFKFVGDFSVIAYFKFNSDTGANQHIVGPARGGAGDIRWILGYSDFIKGTYFEIDDNVSDYLVEANTSLFDGQWHHLVGVRDGDNLRIYVDGIEDATPVDISSAGSLSANTNDMRIGLQANGVAPLDGCVSFVKVFCCALTGSEINADFQDPFQMYRRQQIKFITPAVGVTTQQIMMISND